MSEESRDLALQALFDQARGEPAAQGDAFTETVMQQADRSRRRAIWLRVGIAVLLAAVSAPLQDVGLVITEVMLISLVEADGGLISQVLAPVNTVGALLSPSHAKE